MAKSNETFTVGLQYDLKEVSFSLPAAGPLAHASISGAQPSSQSSSNLVPSPSDTTFTFSPSGTKSLGQATSATSSNAPGTNDSSINPTVKQGFEYFNGLHAVLGAGALIAGAVGGWKKWWGPQKNARTLGDNAISDWGVPTMGSYKCLGDPGSDAAINALIAEAKDNISKVNPEDTPDILISGSKDVGKYWIGKGIAAELGWRALRIKCNELAIIGEIPEHFVKVLEKRVLKAMQESGQPGVVLILDEIDGFACSRQEKFTRKLASRLLSPESPLRKYAVVVGTLDTESIPSCSNDPIDQELLDVLRSALKKQVEVAAPKNANGIARLIQFKLEDRIRHDTEDSTYTLPVSEIDTVLLLAKALPGLRSDALARELAINVSESIRNRDQPLREILIRRALDQIVGVAAEHASDPLSEGIHAAQVVCEGLVAHAVGLGVLALGVQTRVEDAYVCRERLADCDNDSRYRGENVGAALAEIVTVWARYLGTKPPYNTCIESVPLVESDIHQIVGPISQRLAKILLVEREEKATPEAIESLAMDICKNARATARKMLQLLSTGENEGKINELMSRLAGTEEAKSTGPYSKGNELCCRELDLALGQFKLKDAKERFVEFVNAPDSLILEG